MEEQNVITSGEGLHRSRFGPSPTHSKPWLAGGRVIAGNRPGVTTGTTTRN